MWGLHFASQKKFSNYLYIQFLNPYSEPAYIVYQIEIWI